MTYCNVCIIFTSRCNDLTSHYFFFSSRRRHTRFDCDWSSDVCSSDLYIDLFAEDGMYWMPPEPSHATWDGMPAIFAEDKNLMTVRMKRVLHPDAWSQRPLWGTNHVVGNVVVERESPNGDVVVRSRFHMMELRRDDVRHFAGLYIHHLKKTKDGYRITLQRVDMTNAQAAYDYVLQGWV